MMRIGTGSWATVGFTAFLLGSSACAQPGERDKSTNRAATESSERGGMSGPTERAGQTANANPRASPAQAPAAAGGDRASAAAKSGEIQGRVERVDRANNLTIAGSESAGLAFDEFKVDSNTEVTIGGAKASVASVNPGDEVRASFSERGDSLHLDRLQVVPSAGAEVSAPATSGGRGEKGSSSGSPNKNP